jgi:OmpA-OmpF porin, OOP family
MHRSGNPRQSGLGSKRRKPPCGRERRRGREQIAKLLKETPALKLLVVGHTDNIGSFSFNMDLSQRRAAAVVSALATRYAVRRDRLTPVGVSFASPVASNQAEAGRAANRRVELVENSPASR